MSIKPYLRYQFQARSTANKGHQSTMSEEAADARMDLGLFGEYVADKAPADHHQEWIDALVTYRNNECLKLVAGDNLEILAPRGSAKSTWIALFVAFAIGHNPGIPIIYASYSENVALSRSRIIKRIIESSKYREVFPNIKPGKRWADSDWEIDKEFAGVTDLDFDYTFYATGILGSITSRRSGLIIYDDLIKSSESIANPDIRERMVTNIGEVLQPTLIPGGRQIDIGTRFRADDVHAVEFTEERGWEVIVQSAIVEDDDGHRESYWPERFTLESLEETEKDKPVIFSFQYQNVITRISEISINPDWIKKGQIPLEFDTYIIGCDLSASEKEKSDYTVFILLGKNHDDPHVYALDVVRGRWSGNVSKINELLKMLAEWGLIEYGDSDHHGKPTYYSGSQTVYLCAEGVAYQSSLEGDWKQRVLQELQISNIVYRKAKTVGDKLSRLKGVSGLFENGVVVFNQHAHFGRTIRELTNFGSLDHDDCVDAMVYGLRSITARRPLDAA